MRQVLHDCEDRAAEANARLDEMGHAIGCRLIEEFLAKTNTTRCGSTEPPSSRRERFRASFLGALVPSDAVLVAFLAKTRRRESKCQTKPAET